MSTPIGEPERNARGTLLALVRHGETDWNRDRRIQGSTDIPLNETGRAQAAVAARRLATRSWDAIVASPLSRAAETARIIAGELDLELGEPDPDLMERRHGVLEGLTTAEREARFAAGAQIEGFEHDDSLVRRARAALARIATRHEGSAVIVVTHGGVIHSLVRSLSGGSLPARGDLIVNASIHDLRFVDGTLELAEFRPGEQLDPVA